MRLPGATGVELFSGFSGVFMGNNVVISFIVRSLFIIRWRFT